METAEVKQGTYEGWAIVEVMGHQRYAGFVKTEAFGGAVLFQVDVPALAERERALTSPTYIEGDEASLQAARYCPAGTKVKEGAVQGYTKLLGAPAIFCITACTEEAALRAVEEMQSRPLLLVALPEKKALAEAVMYACCGGNPHEGHNLGCPYLDDHEEEDEHQYPRD